MMRYIIILLLLSSGLTAQTKLRQIERSATKWHVPAAWDSIPGVTGHAMKYIDLETLMDTVGIQQFGIDSLDYRNDSLLIWVGGGYYFAIIPQGLSGSGDDGSVAYWHQDTIAGDTVHFWDRSNKRLGLNTKTPSSLLHVKKNEYALPVAEFDNPGTNGQTVLIKHGASSDGRYPLKIETPSATNYFDARGYLGLGVSPSYPLHVKNASGISRFENTNTNGDAGFDLYHASKQWRIAMNAEGGTTNNVHFRDVTGSRYPITLQSSNGYVGILNLTPARELHVTGRVRVSTLDSDLTPPTTAGTTKMVITDEDGDLSFANIPSGGGIDSTNIVGGWGIESTESPANTFNLIADSTQVASQYDLTLKQDKLTLTTTGTSGAATLVGSTLNVPQYGNGDITGITTTAPITGGTTSGNATLGLSYDPTYMGLNGSNELYPLYNVATWNANALRGRSISITAPTNGQVYAYNSAGNNWVPTTTGTGTVTSVQLAAGTGISISGTNPITTSGTITVTNSSPNVTTNLNYTGTTSPVTLNSSDGTDVTFTAGSGITLSATGSNMTITASGGGGATNLSYGALNTGGVSTYGDYVMIDNSSGSDVYLHDGDGIDIVRSASNYAGYKLNQSWGYLSTTTGATTAITTTATKVDFVANESNGPMTVSAANDNITVTNAGRYEFNVNLTMFGAANRRVTLELYVGGITQGRPVLQSKAADDYEELSLSGQITLAASAVVDVRISYNSGVGTGTDISYYYPRFSLKRIN